MPFGPDHPVPAELDDSGLARVREEYRQAAERVNRLDIRLVELHGAHGYLLHIFLSPLSNRRDDRYGGSVAARASFVAEVVGLVRNELEDDRILGIRLHAAERLGVPLDVPMQFWMARPGRWPGARFLRPKAQQDEP